MIKLTYLQSVVYWYTESTLGFFTLCICINLESELAPLQFLDIAMCKNKN